MNATNGQSLIEPGQIVHVLNIFSSTEGLSEPQYEEYLINRTKKVSIKLTDEHANNLSATISNQMFNPRPTSANDYIWKVYLSKLKPTALDLNYVVGDTYIDLSGLPIERLKINTGSANVKINYNKGFENLLEMDTFLIKVDMGTLEANNLHLSRSSIIIADVGFGKVKMDFVDAETINTNVRATIGAGKLEIILPKNDLPVKININDSPLCHIIIPKEFEKSADHVFVSREFKENQVNFINFDIDVAVGSIEFKTARR